MRESDDFGKPDRAGLEALMHEPLVQYQGMIFRKGAFDQVSIDSLLKGKSPEEVQRELNHTHLFLYAADIEVQRQWTKELEDHWRKRIEHELSGLKAHVSHDDNGQEVIATFWVSAKMS